MLGGTNPYCSKFAVLLVCRAKFWIKIKKIINKLWNALYKVTALAKDLKLSCINVSFIYNIEPKSSRRRHLKTNDPVKPIYLTCIVSYLSSQDTCWESRTNLFHAG